MHFKLTIEYAGTRYSGWQIQKNARTVQGELARAIGAVTGARDFELYGSGRTDAGVHALAQVAHLDVQTSLSPEQLLRRVNEELPADISILHAEVVRHRFHARHDARGRSYLYQISKRKTAFAKPFVWWVKDELDVERMRSAASHFVGRHDFHAFSDDDPSEKSTDVLVEGVEIHQDGDLIIIRVEGSHFIWKMVRRMVGVLVEVGRGGIAPEDLERVLQSGPTGSKQLSPANISRLTAPAAGLFLERVYYERERESRPYALSRYGAISPARVGR